MVKTESLDKRYEVIVDKLNLILNTLEDLIEDPIFLDTIHGEQELALDLTLELIDQISSQFQPKSTVEESLLLMTDDSYDTL
jgi:hypothetical protein